MFFNIHIGSVRRLNIFVEAQLNVSLAIDTPTPPPLPNTARIALPPFVLFTPFVAGRSYAYVGWLRGGGQCKRRGQNYGFVLYCISFLLSFSTIQTNNFVFYAPLVMLIILKKEKNKISYQSIF
jgi:hypothetical protein